MLYVSFNLRHLSLYLAYDIIMRKRKVDNMRFRDLSSYWKRVIVFLFVIVLVLLIIVVVHIYLTLGSLLHVMMG